MRRPFRLLFPCLGIALAACSVNTTPADQRSPFRYGPDGKLELILEAVGFNTCYEAVARVGAPPGERTIRNALQVIVQLRIRTDMPACGMEVIPIVVPLRVDVPPDAEALVVYHLLPDGKVDSVVAHALPKRP